MRLCAVVLVCGLAAAACADDPPAGARVGAPTAPDSSSTTALPDPPSSTSTPAATAEAAAAPASTTTAPTVRTTTTTAPTTTNLPTTTATTSTTTIASPPFHSSVAAVTVAELGASWREGCPVGPDELRALTVRHHRPGGGVADGLLIVHRDHADALVGVFASIYGGGFPIASMRPVSEFGGDDDSSMAADNSSAFNCREVAGSPGVWSQHSFGTAVDLNPLVNPFVRGGTVDPPAGAPYADRSADHPGMIRPGDVVTGAFGSIGWGWGGNWSSAKDYQHFSANGR